MSSRVRLTLIYASLILATTIVVGLTFWYARRTGVMREIAPIAVERANLTRNLLQQGMEQGDQITITTLDTIADGVDTIITPRPILAPALQKVLDSLPGYIIVLNHDRHSIYWSDDVRRLSNDQWTKLRDNLPVLPNNGPAGVLWIGREVMFAASDFPDKNSELRRVVIGIPTDPSVAMPTDSVTAALFFVVFVLVASVLIAYITLGKPFTQLQRIIDDLSAISDGRSLHKRVAIEGDAEPEIEEQVDVLNTMIARLENSFKALRQFTADASHELKTPLAVLRADIERAMSSNASPKEKLVALEEALQEVTRMSNLVESLLTLARADEGRFDLHLEPVELGSLVQEVYETATILGEGANISVALPYTTDVTVMGDRTRLRQLFLNIITNAIKYTPAGGRVDIGLGQHPDNVTFAVRDTGIGIAAADIPHIFDRFWRADRVRTREEGGGSGMGLGLSIAKWIAQAHGGTLTVSSRLGQGSLFTVTLPRSDGAAGHGGTALTA